MLQLSAELERELPDARRVAAVRDRGRLEGDRVAGLDRRMEGAGKLGLDRDHAPAGADRGLDAGDQPAAADGDHDRVGTRDVLLELEPDRAGAGEDERVLVRVNEDAARLLDQPLQPLERIDPCRRLEVDGRAVGARRRDLLRRGRPRHHDERVDAFLRGGPGNRLRMVAGRDRDHASPPLVPPERAELVERASRLERACALEELALQVCAERARTDGRRSRESLADRRARPQDVVTRQHAAAALRRGRLRRRSPR